MDDIDKDCIACYGTGIHIHVYSSGQPMWGGCEKCNPDRITTIDQDGSEKEPSIEDLVGITKKLMGRDALIGTQQYYYWIEIANDSKYLTIENNIIEIVAGIWQSSEAAETALKNFSDKPNWKYKNRTIIVLNHDCLNTLLNCNEFSYKD